MTTTELMELQRTIGHLRQCVGSLRTVYGDVNAVRRLANDVDRLDIDARDLHDPPPRPTVGAGSERVQVPDTPYDRTLWQGVDDEGLGSNPHEGK